MKIFLSYGHDSNALLIERIRDYLSKDAEGNLKHEVWIDTSEIKAGMNWREKIVKGLLESDIVLAGLSEHSTKDPGVCRDEISISIGVKGGNIRTILLEPSNIVAPPAMISHIQWLDMSDWKEHEKEGFESEYFQEKFRQIAEMVETPENERFNGEITKLKEVLEPISSISRIRSLTQKEMYGRRWLYEKIEEWDKIRIQLVRKNPSQYLQPLGMILLRMAGFCCQASDEFGTRLCLMKARFIYERTDLKHEQYEGALQQILDNLSQIKRARKWFFGMFRINEDKLNEEFEEFVNYFK